MPEPVDRPGSTESAGINRAIVRTRKIGPRASHVRHWTRANVAWAALGAVVALILMMVGATASEGQGGMGRAGSIAGTLAPGAGDGYVPVGSPTVIPSSSPLTSDSPSPGASAPSASNAPVRPPTLDGPVPSDLRPTLAGAPTDYPTPYLDHCHVGQDGRASSNPCLYGDLKSTTTIALFGDSHALSWFPAVERVAVARGWRLLSLTMSTCSPADIPIWNSSYTHLNVACAAWRAAAIRRLVHERPAVILVAGTRGFAAADAPGRPLVGDARVRTWQAGMQRTLARLVSAAGRVIVIADTPLSLVDPPVCLASHPTSLLACASPVRRAINYAWLAVEHASADSARAGFIDSSSLVCPTSPCPAVIGRILVYRNPGHLTATFVATLARRLGEAIDVELATQGR